MWLACLNINMMWQSRHLFTKKHPKSISGWLLSLYVAGQNLYFVFSIAGSVKSLVFIWFLQTFQLVYIPNPCIAYLQNRYMYMSDFSLISGFFTNLPLPQKKRSSHQGKKEIACITLNILQIFLSKNPFPFQSSFQKHSFMNFQKSSKITSMRFRGLCPLDQRETQACYPFFRICDFVKSHPLIHVYNTLEVQWSNLNENLAYCKADDGIRFLSDVLSILRQVK